ETQLPARALTLSIILSDSAPATAARPHTPRRDTTASLRIALPSGSGHGGPHSSPSDLSCIQSIGRTAGLGGDVPPRNLLARVGWAQPAQGRSWVPMQDPEGNQCSSDAGPRLTTWPTQHPFDPYAVRRAAHA